MGRKMLGIALVVLSLVVAHPAWADYQAGQRALDAGNVDEALAQWRVAANAGDRRVMLALGRLHVKGLGVPQSYVEAHAWFNLAASQRRGGGGGRAGRARGEDDAGADRDCAGTRDGVAPERSASPGPPNVGAPQPCGSAGRGGLRSASSAGDSRGAGVAGRAGLPARSGRRHLGPAHGSSLPGIPA